MQHENFRKMLENSAKQYGDRLAFRVKPKTQKKPIVYDDITYKRLLDEVKTLSAFLIENGLSDKRVAVIGKNSYEWMLVYLSVLCMGGVIVPLDRGLLDFEIKDQLERAEADMVFCSSELYEVVSNSTDAKIIQTDGDEFKSIINTPIKSETMQIYDNIKIDNEKMSVLLFTSGTTAKSKAVMLSQKNILADIYGMSLWEPFEKDDINLALLPFHHTFGMVAVVLFLSLGMCNVFCEGLKIAKALREYRVTVLVGVPRIIEEMYKTIMRTIDKTGMTKKVNFGIKLSKFLLKFKIDIRRKLFKSIIDGLGGGMRFVIIGAAAAKSEIQQWFNDVGILAVQGYGLTETSPCITAENYQHIRPGSVGFAIPNVKIDIIDKDENGIGEIVAKGDNVMLGYYNDEENTKKVLTDDGWFSTGDMGYTDKDGYLFITGRKKNVIVLRNGKNVFPEEIESLLEKCPIIKECVVYNECDGEKDTICAKIVYDDSITLEEAEKTIKAWIFEVNQKLIIYKQIKKYELTDVEMEKTTTLKIKRNKI